jgi:murein DD-endopeptidase MepM/ murein hydrolase activator NlpD
VGGVILAAAVGVLCLASPAAEANSPSEVPVQLPESTVGAEITEPTPEPVLVADNSATNDIATPTPTQTAVLITAEATASDANLISVSLLWCVPDYTSVSVYTSDTHHGIDIAAAKGADILAAADGTVTFAGWSGTYGYYVEIDHGNGLITRYKHCSKVNVKEGESVLQGQKIAAVGSTGRSTGNHCHFEAYQDDICLTINEPSK